MKICMILTNTLEPNVRVLKEAAYLVRNSAQVEILRWDRSKNANNLETKTVDGIKFTDFGCYSVAGTGLKQIPAFVRFIARVRRYLKSHTYDYYHLHALDGGIAGMFALPRGAKYVFDMHEFFEVGGRMKRLLIKRTVMHIIRKSMASLYENDKYLKKPYGRYHQKLFSMKNYPDHGLIERKEKTQSDSFRIGYHGVVRSQIPYFRALFEAVRDMPGVRVDVNGGGIDYEQLVQMAEGLDNVHVNGPYDGIKESTRLYQNTDLLFCGYDKLRPHHKDCEAIKFYEAIITATPMIMQCDIGMGDKVAGRGYGLAVETDNAGEISKAITRLMTDTELYQRCQQNEMRDADMYCWETEVDTLKKVYHV